MHKCYKCDNMAVWWYLPGSDKDLNYYCDECVPRFCSCNIVIHSDDIKRDTYEYYKDELGRDLPCVEYEYCEAGV